MNTETLKLKGHAYAACAFIAIFAIACASEPPQSLTSQLAATDTSIAQAEQSGAAVGALTELQASKDKRAKAQTALAAKEYEDAMRLAQQAQLDAQYAARKAQAGAAQKSAAEVDRGTEKLRLETERNLNNERERPPGSSN